MWKLSCDLGVNVDCFKNIPPEQSPETDAIYQGRRRRGNWSFAEALEVGLGKGAGWHSLKGGSNLFFS